MYTIMSSVYSDSLISSLPIWMPFISFVCLIVVAKTSKTMLKSSGESRHPCHVPDLSEKPFSFSPLSIYLLWVYHKWLYVQECSLYTHFGEGLDHEWMLDFVKCFLCIYGDDHVVSDFSFVNVLCDID